MKRLAILFAISLSMCSTQMMAGNSIDKVRNDRYRKIGFFHLGTGIAAFGTDNIDFSTFMLAGMGSNRNVINVDIGAGYDFSTSAESTCINGHRIPVFISVALNVWKNEKDCFHLDAGYSYGIVIGASYKEDRYLISDKKLLFVNSTPFAGVGYRLNMLDFSLKCAYATAPKFNQKYVYESESYDYDALDIQIFNRLQIGFSVIYYFNFGL